MKLQTLFKITPEPFALDLSDRSIKIIKLTKRGRDIFLENFGESAVEPGLLEDGSILEAKKLSQTVRKALGELKKGPLRSPYVSCSLPEQKTYQRVVQLPLMEKEELTSAVQWEVEANIPIPFSETYFDWEAVPSSMQKDGHTDILVSAAPREIVDSYSAVLEGAGLKPVSFEAESVAIARAIVPRRFLKKPVFLLDFGRTRTSFVIYAGHSLRFSSSVKMSGYLVTQNIMRAMQVDEEEAVRLKEDVGLDQEKDAKVYEAIIPAMTDLKEQMQKYIEFYSANSTHSHSSSPEVASIILCGGGAKIRGVEKYLALSLGIPVDIANPWTNILKPPMREVPELPLEDSVRYSTAIGLALNSFI